MHFYAPILQTLCIWLLNHKHMSKPIEFNGTIHIPRVIHEHKKCLQAQKLNEYQILQISTVIWSIWKQTILFCLFKKTKQKKQTNLE